MKKLLWLDDVRNPFITDWLMQYAPQFAYGEGETIWVKSYSEFVDWINNNDLPDMICFDHDLADNWKLRSESDITDGYDMTENKEYTGFDCAKWLVDYCLDRDLNIPEYNIQSANPVGSENIRGLLENYKKYRNE